MDMISIKNTKHVSFVEEPLIFESISVGNLMEMSGCDTIDLSIFSIDLSKSIENIDFDKSIVSFSE